MTDDSFDIIPDDYENPRAKALRERDEARAEVERLRGENEQWAIAAGMSRGFDALSAQYAAARERWKQKMDALTAERDALLAVVRAVADAAYNHEGTLCSVNPKTRELEPVQDVARSALVAAHDAATGASASTTADK